MKIKNKFFIPLIAVVMAILMSFGSFTGMAGDTSAQKTTFSQLNPTDLTYSEPTYAPTSDVDKIIQDAIKDSVTVSEGTGDEIREGISIFGRLLRKIQEVLQTIVDFFEKIGNSIGNSGRF